jgi:hypothetical protein
MSIAKDENAIVWTDDQFVAMLAEVDFGLERIWTQLAFKTFEKAGKLDREMYLEISSKLLGWHYLATIFTAGTIFKAGHVSKWDVNNWPFRQALQAIATGPLSAAAKGELVLDFFRLLRRSEVNEIRQSLIVRATLNAIGTKEPVLWMTQRLESVFSIDFKSEEFIRVELSDWLRFR